MRVRVNGIALYFDVEGAGLVAESGSMREKPTLILLHGGPGMIEALQKGDEVVTAGGVLGRVTRITDNYVSIEIAERVEIQVQRPAVQLVLPKGTIKNI